MNGPQAFVSDFDGTLDFHDGTPIRNDDRETIEVFQADGGLFGICTGRSADALLMDTSGRIVLDFAICDTGATIYDREFNLIFERTLSREVAERLWDAYHDRSTWSGIISAGGGYYSIGPGPDQWVVAVDSFDELPTPIHGLSFGTETNDESTDLAAEVNRDFAGLAVAHQNLNSIDIVPPGCSKGEGVERVRTLLKAGAIAAMGDSCNDLSMLEAADVAYTFPNAPEELRLSCDELASSVSAALSNYMDRLGEPHLRLLAS